MNNKFKVWDKEKKCWINDYEDIFMDEDGEVYIIEEKTWAYQSYMDKENITDKVEVIHSTGLTDINGKEIYENDIVKLLHAAHHDNEIGQIIYRNSETAFRIFNTYLYEKNLGSFVSSELEVVGNIYENLELLVK